jgi:maleylacetate reductase
VTSERFELIGRNAMMSIFTRANPRTIKGPEDIVQILQLAA